MFSVQDERRVAQDNLRVLSEQTGGFALVNTNDFSEGFDRIIEDNSSYYVLGYYSTNDRADGRYRKIDVRVNGRPGLVVRARAGYVAPRGKAPEVQSVAADGTNVFGELAELIASPVPVSGLTFSTTAAAFRGGPPSGAVVVSLEVSGKDLKLTPTSDGRFGGKLEMMVAAFDSENKALDSVRSSIDLGFKKETYDLLMQQGSFRFVAQLKLPPGQYQLQTALLEPETRKGGSVQYDLEVPDFAKLPLSMSGVTIGSAAASFWPTVADKTLNVRMPVAPTALREFAASDGLAVFAHIYGNQPTPSHTLDLTTTVRSDDGRIVFNSHEERTSDEVQGAGSEYANRLTLKGWAPGLYVLTVEARSRLSGTQPVSRSVQFRVR